VDARAFRRGAGKRRTPYAARHCGDVAQRGRLIREKNGIQCCAGRLRLRRRFHLGAVVPSNGRMGAFRVTLAKVMRMTKARNAITGHAYTEGWMLRAQRMLPREAHASIDDAQHQYVEAPELHSLWRLRFVQVFRRTHKNVHVKSIEHDCARTGRHGGCQNHPVAVSGEIAFASPRSKHRVATPDRHTRQHAERVHACETDSPYLIRVMT
jgi:hypothetical protein